MTSETSEIPKLEDNDSISHEIEQNYYHNDENLTEESISEMDSKILVSGMMIESSPDSNLYEQRTQNSKKNLSISSSNPNEEFFSSKEDNNENNSVQQILPPLETSNINDNMVEEALNGIIKSKKSPSRNLWDQTYDYARKMNILHLLNEEYDQAAQCEEAISFLQQQKNYEIWIEEYEKIQKQFKKKLENVQSQVFKINEKENIKIQSINEEYNKKLEILKINHEKEIQEFEEKWSNPKSLLPFSKPSPILLQLKKKQKSMALSKQFQQAKEIKQICEDLEKNESLEATKKASQLMNSQFSSLLEKQQKEIDCLFDNTQRKISIIKLEKEKSIDVNLKQQKHLESKVNNQKIKINLPLPNLIIKNNDNSITNRSMGTPGVITSRTRNQFQKFRQSSENSKLELTQLNVKSLIRPQSALLTKREIK